MKILVLNYEYPPVGGGGGRLCQKVCEALAERGHEVRVVTAGVGALACDEVVRGVRILRPRSFRKKEDTCTVPEMGLYLATALPTALGQARGWRPQIAHAHFVVPTGLLALALLRLAGLPFVVTAHLGDVPGGVPEQTESLFKVAGPPARAVWQAAAARTCVSTFVAGLAREAYGLEAEVIPNGIPPVEVPAKVHDTKEVGILMVGRLSVQKNPLLAIRALSKLRELPWRFDIVGDGPLEGEVRALVADEALTDRVHFHGWLEEEQVRAKMRDAEILLMPSLHEGLPMVAVEALWHGLAIVGGRIGGLADVVENDSNGFLCDLEAEAFAQGLLMLLLDGDLRAAMGRRSRVLAQRFDFTKCVDAYEAVLVRGSQAARQRRTS